MLALYNQTHSEITSYRDIEWKILGWILAILAGVITLVKINVFLAQDKPILQTILSIITVVIAIYGIWHIHYVHDKLTQNRKLRQNIQNDLNLTTKLKNWNFLSCK